MMQTLINSGKYTFVGTLGELKKLLKNPQIEITRDGRCCGLWILIGQASFEYGGTRHNLKIVKDFLKDDVLYLEYKGC